MDSTPTKLDYFTEMLKLRSESTVVSFVQDDLRCALVLASTIFHPQGGGQPADTGSIEVVDSGTKFVVEDVRSRDGIVFHYGFVENSTGDCQLEFLKGKEVLLQVDEARRKLNSRLHSAGHLIDACVKNIGLGHLEPGKGYHFPDGPFVEYKGVIPQSELQSKQEELEMEANKMISKGGKVVVAILSYEEASEQCGGSLPHYIAKDSTPRIVSVGNHSGPCGGTHVVDLREIISMKYAALGHRLIPVIRWTYPFLLRRPVTEEVLSCTQLEGPPHDVAFHFWVISTVHYGATCLIWRDASQLGCSSGG